MNNDLSLSKIQNKSLILVFANNAYFKVLENWLAFISAHDINNYLVIALDAEVYERLQKSQKTVLFRPCGNGLGDLWVHRIHVINEFLEKGIDVIHSDADAVWLKNPLGYINEQDSDIVFSQGTFWPRDVHEKWGFVLCCGFFFIKSNSRTLQFMKDLKKRVELDKDDQVSVNRELLERDIEWEHFEFYERSFKDIKFKCFDQDIKGSAGDISVTLLPHAKFQRVHEVSEDPYIKHMVSEKNSLAILERLDECGCLFSNVKGKKVL